MKKLLITVLALVTLALIETEVMAQTRTINLNTGYDQWSNAPLNVGQQDNEWRVTQSTPNNPPPPPPATGRPADVVNDTVWAFLNTALPTNFPNSRWISFAPNAGQGSSIVASYKYSFYFTLPGGGSSPQLTMKLGADDHITEIKLNNCPALFTGSGGIFANNPPLMLSSALTCFDSGPNVNVLTVTVENTVAGTITGLIVDGTLTYQDCDRLAVKDIPGLTSITFWESTVAAPTQHTLLKGDPGLAGQIGSLGPFNDFVGAQGEFYDVFYSTWDGTPSLTGQFVTIEAVWGVGAPSGGGLNIARVDLNGTGQFADSVASFVALGNNAMPNDVGKAVDLDPSVLTDTTMGNTIGQTQRLRITVGFPCRIPCVQLPSITLNPAAGVLPPTLVNVAYSQTFTATGGCASAFTYTVTSGALPIGLTLAANGVLSGTATTPGNFTFTVTATDSCGCSKSETYTLQVDCPTVPSRLFNTGVANDGSPLASGATDPHYVLLNTSPVFPNALVLFPNQISSSYVANTSTSQWLGPTINPLTTGPGGFYTYRTTFNLPNCDLSTAVISGQWASDNEAEIFLNGSTTNLTTGPNDFGFYTPFVITGGFVPGVNTLDFRVRNRLSSAGAKTATGLRVEMSGTAKCCPCAGVNCGNIEVRKWGLWKRFLLWVHAIFKAPRIA